MLIFAIVAVFIAGLMVGRTPEYLGKKIEAFEMKMASLVILIMPLVVLLLRPPSRWSIAAGHEERSPTPARTASGVLYAFTSAGNNNGSAFAGLSANKPFYNVAGGLAMLVARFWLVDPDAGDRRLAGARRSTCRPGRDAADAHAAVRRAADRRRRAGRRPDLLPGAGARPDRRAPADAAP